MGIQYIFQKSLDFFGHKPIVVEVADVKLTSDAGLLPIRQLDEAWQFTEQIADALRDTRRRASVDHSMLQMVRSRVVTSVSWVSGTYLSMCFEHIRGRAKDSIVKRLFGQRLQG